MKAIGNHKWKMLGAGLLVLMLALALVVPFGGHVMAANANVTVSIPPAVQNEDLSGAQVCFRLGPNDIGPYTNGQVAVLTAGTTYSWKLKINGYITPLRTGFVAVDGATLTVTAADYCKMKVLVDTAMKNRDNTSGYITFYNWATPYYNNDELYFPMGAQISWYVNVNGKRSAAHYKTIDCTPLDTGEFAVVVNSYCEMKIIVPAALQTAGARVRIYGISPQTFTGDGTETVVLPMGQTITWYLKINGKEAAHTGKPVDCTPINVTAADYCYVKNNTVSPINIYPSFTVAAGDSILFPTGITIEWKPTTQPSWPGTQKTVDCTPIGP